MITLAAGLVAVAVPIAFVVLLLGCLQCFFKKKDGFSTFNDTDETTASEARVNSGFTIGSDRERESTLSSSIQIEPLPDILAETTPRKPKIACVEKSKQETSLKLISVHHPFPRRQLTYLKEIGSGWFGQILESEAERITTGVVKSRVVVKMLKVEATKSEQKMFLEDVAPYRELEHLNILRLLGQCTESSPLLMILEYAQLGDLKTYLKSHKHEADHLIQQNRLLKFCTDAASGLACLHRHSYIHQDLAARNCVVSADLTVKIGDYGVSEEVFKEDYYITSQEMLPIRWMAPETLSHQSEEWQTAVITREANIWSFGVLLWEVFMFGKQPYSNMTDIDMLQNVIVDKMVKLSEPDTNIQQKDRLYEVMQFCWLNPIQRPSIEDTYALLQHLYKKIDGGLQSEFETKWDSLIPSEARVVQAAERAQVHRPKSASFDSDFVSAAENKQKPPFSADLLGVEELNMVRVHNSQSVPETNSRHVAIDMSADFDLVPTPSKPLLPSHLTSTPIDRQESLQATNTQQNELAGGSNPALDKSKPNRRLVDEFSAITDSTVNKSGIVAGIETSKETVSIEIHQQPVPQLSGKTEKKSPEDRASSAILRPPIEEDIIVISDESKEQKPVEKELKLEDKFAEDNVKVLESKPETVSDESLGKPEAGDSIVVVSPTDGGSGTETEQKETEKTEDSGRVIADAEKTADVAKMANAEKAADLETTTNLEKIEDASQKPDLFTEMNHEHVTPESSDSLLSAEKGFLGSASESNLQGQSVKLIESEETPIQTETSSSGETSSSSEPALQASSLDDVGAMPSNDKDLEERVKSDHEGKPDRVFTDSMIDVSPVTVEPNSDRTASLQIEASLVSGNVSVPCQSVMCESLSSWEVLNPNKDGSSDIMVSQINGQSSEDSSQMGSVQSNLITVGQSELSSQPETGNVNNQMAEGLLDLTPNASPPPDTSHSESASLTQQSAELFQFMQTTSSTGAASELSVSKVQDEMAHGLISLTPDVSPPSEAEPLVSSQGDHTVNLLGLMPNQSLVGTPGEAEQMPQQHEGLLQGFEQDKTPGHLERNKTEDATSSVLLDFSTDEQRVTDMPAPVDTSAKIKEGLPSLMSNVTVFDQSKSTNVEQKVELLDFTPDVPSANPQGSDQPEMSNNKDPISQSLLDFSILDSEGNLVSNPSDRSGEALLEFGPDLSTSVQTASDEAKSKSQGEPMKDLMRDPF